MIELRQVTKWYGAQVVIDRLDLDLAPGVTALMGPNGSGKTTLGRLLLGLETPDDGSITGLAGVRRAAVFQEDRLCPQLTAVANVRLVLERGTGRSEVVGHLEQVGLCGESLTKPVHELSGGQRRRVAIVRALMASAGLVVLDEPFTGLDAETRPAVLSYVARRCAGRTAVLITHDATDVASFDARLVELGPTPAG